MGGEVSSLMTTGLTGVDAFDISVTSSTSRTGSLVVSEPHEVNEKTIKKEAIIDQNHRWYKILIPSLDASSSFSNFSSLSFII